MDDRDGLGGFLDALLGCFGIWSSRFDGELHMTWSNSAIPNLHRKLLVTPERAELIRRHIGPDAPPLIVGAKIGLLWSVVTDFRDGETRLFVLGPILTQPVTWDMAEKLIEPYHLSFETKRGLIDCMTIIPAVSTVSFFQFTVLLHRLVTGRTVSVSDLAYDMAPARREASEEDAHIPLINEHELLRRVKSGDLDYRSALAAAGAASRGIRAGIDPIRQAKYSVVAFITLCARAAIEGGLSADTAYTLSDTYTETVDACRSISEIASVSHAMYEDFIRRVHRVHTSADISRPVQSCRDYIDGHVSDALTVEGLAERAGYAPYYFTKLFKAETGVTLKEYILQARVLEAKRLLVNTQMSVSEIAESLRFSSQSWFTHQFERLEGVSPIQFRHKNQKVD